MISKLPHPELGLVGHDRSKVCIGGRGLKRHGAAQPGRELVDVGDEPRAAIQRCTAVMATR